jgi:anti-sigma factor RsiW
MLTCKELTEIVTDYLEGRLSFMQRLQFHLHVGMCRHCRAYLRQMKMTVKTLGKLPDEPIPAGVRDELLERFRSVRPDGDGSPAPAPAGISRSLGFLALIDRLGANYGWALAGVIIAGVTAALFLSGLSTGSVGEGTRCLLVELGSGVTLVAAVATFAWTKRSRLSASTWTALAMIGSLAGFAMLQATCPTAHIAPHVLLFHLGGILVAGATGLIGSRLPVWRQ